MNSTNSESIRLLRDVDAYMVPSGDEVKLLAGNLVRITQALGGNYTVIMNGNMVQIRAENADALGSRPHSGAAMCYDPVVHSRERENRQNKK